MLPRALGRSVTADDQFLFVQTLDLYPCSASSSRLISGIAQFTDNSFQSRRFTSFNSAFGSAPNAPETRSGSLASAKVFRATPYAHAKAGSSGFCLSIAVDRKHKNRSAISDSPFHAPAITETTSGLRYRPRRLHHRSRILSPASFKESVSSAKRCVRSFLFREIN